MTTKQMLEVPLLKKAVRIGILTVVALLAVAAWAELAHAGGARATQAASGAHARMTMDQAVRMVERHYHARVVRAETRKHHGRTVYVLRLLDRSGRVFTVQVDAASGRIL